MEARALQDESAAVEALGINPALVQSSANLGVISAAFAVAVPASEPLPADEQINTRDLGTIKGPPIAANYREEAVKIGEVREVVSIRYTRRNP